MTDVGPGRFCELETPVSLAEAIERVKKHTGIKTVQVSLGLNSSLETPIRTYAVCAGSGSSVLKGVAADLYITGELGIISFIIANEICHIFFPSFEQVKCHITNSSMRLITMST